MRIVSMTEFIISEWDKDISADEFSQRAIKYATFLKRPLKLGMFVPTDDDNNPLIFNYPPKRIGQEIAFEYFSKQFDKAKENVFFEGWSWLGTYAESRNGLAIDEEICNDNTMEELIANGYDLYLTDTAIEKLGL